MHKSPGHETVKIKLHRHVAPVIFDDHFFREIADQIAVIVVDIIWRSRTADLCRGTIEVNAGSERGTGNTDKLIGAGVISIASPGALEGTFIFLQNPSVAEVGAAGSII